jgi:hypothetical protein
MRYIIVYSPECVEGAILEVGLSFYPILGSPILGVLRIVRHDGYFQKPSGSQLHIGELGSLEADFL